MFRKLIISVSVLLSLATFDPAYSASQGPEETVLDYFSRLAHKDRAGIMEMCDLSAPKTKQLERDLELYFKDDIYIGVVPRIEDVRVSGFVATVVVDVKMSMFYLDDEDHERQAIRTIFEIEAPESMGSWVITNIYSKEIAWPVPALCEEKLKVLAEEQDPKAAIRGLEELRIRYGYFPQIGNVLALKQISLGLTREAIRTLNEVLEAEPADYFAHAVLADLEYKSGEKETAKRHAVNALRFCPVMQNPNFHAIFGYVLVGSGLIDEGREQFEWYKKRCPDGEYGDKISMILDELGRISKEMGSLDFTVTVDGKVPDACRLWLYPFDKKEAIGEYFSGHFFSEELFPGTYSVLCEIRGVDVWSWDIKIGKSEAAKRIMDLATGRLIVDVTKSKGLPLLDAEIYLISPGKEDYIDHARDFKAEFRVIPSIYELLIVSGDGRAGCRLKDIEVKPGRTRRVSYDFGFQRVLVTIDRRGKSEDIKGYVFHPGEREHYIEGFSGRKSAFFLPAGSYQMLLVYAGAEKLVDFEVEDDMECNLKIILSD